MIPPDFPLFVLWVWLVLALVGAWCIIFLICYWFGRFMVWLARRGLWERRRGQGQPMATRHRGRDQ